MLTRSGRVVRVLRAISRFVVVLVATILTLTLAASYARFDRRLLQAALTQPVVIISVDQGAARVLGCICAPTLRPDEIAPVLAAALIATEDRRFRSVFNILGIDLRALARSLGTRFASGGSTLHMQLARNALLGLRPTVPRKMAEIGLAMRLALTFRRDDVLRLYLSRVYFGSHRGHPIYGLRDAARAWFGKSPARLDLAESAILVAILNGPSLYNPLRNPRRVARRARLVLDNLRAMHPAMVPAKVDIDAAMPRQIHRLPLRFRHLEDLVTAEAARHLEGQPDGTYLAVTTIDPVAQLRARQILARAVRRAERQGARRAALVSLDPKGRILAMIGGLDYQASAFNLVTEGRRQAASTAKIATYLAALEAGFGPDSPVIDDPEALRSAFRPRNADRRYLGAIPLARCLALSRNVCTLWLAEQTGLAAVSEMALRLGLTETRLPGQNVVLGAFETTPLRLAVAYAAIANGGARVQPLVLRAVVGPVGRVVFRAEPSARPILSPAVAGTMRRLLGGVTRKDGTGHLAAFRGGRAHGKTGTSQENRDAWFVGFADHGVTTAIWVGPEEGGRMAGIAGGGVPAQIFASFNASLYERLAGYIGQAPPDPASFWRDVNLP